MKARQIVPGVYQLSMGFVSAFLIDDGGLTLIDCGIAGSGRGILEAIKDLGRIPAEIKQVLFTQLHGDHTGAAREIQTATGAKLYMHPLDAVDYEKGITMRPNPHTTGLLPKIMTAITGRMSRNNPVEAAPISAWPADGETLPFAGGLKAIHTPGHTSGHTVFLYEKEGGVLFGGDACSNFTRMGPSMLYEDIDEGMRSLAKMAELKFETLCLSHGRVISGGADKIFQKRWGNKIVS